MEPNIWGPHAWFFLHTVVLMYPDQPNELEKQHYLNFFNNLANILPCYICRENYKNHLIKYPIKKSLNNKKDLHIWMVNIHNEVNKIHKKKQYTPEEVEQMYKDIFNKKIKYNINNPDNNCNQFKQKIKTIEKVTKIKILNNKYTIILLVCLFLSSILNYYFLFFK